jgi:predicted enzyme related to lactoylglutathione lyase
MAVLRPHLALTVTDVERSIPFYEALFGAAKDRLIAAGLPDGTPWEVFATHEDVEEHGKKECCVA